MYTVKIRIQIILHEAIQFFPVLFIEESIFNPIVYS